MRRERRDQKRSCQGKFSEKKMRALVHGLSITNDILRPGNEKNIWKRTSI